MEKKITEYRALLIDENNKKFNGVAVFEEDGLVLEKRSRLNGKLKESLKVSYDDIPLDGINRPAFNKVEFKLKDDQYALKMNNYSSLWDCEIFNKLCAICTKKLR